MLNHLFQTRFEHIYRDENRDKQLSEVILRLKNSDTFDKNWYSSQYPDVTDLKMDAVEHYVRVGEFLGRRPTPDFDPVFYMSTYTDMPDDCVNVYLHYVENDQYLNRPTCSEFVRRSIREIERPSENSNECTTLRISYCIPVMNRGDDVRLTLEKNLRQHRGFAGLIEFVIVFFDDDVETHDWVRQSFREDINSGLLRVHHSDLSRWHFSRAKNAFRNLISGRVYSSLDGDNFVTLQESLQIIDAIERHDGFFILHHFSGSWGDGSSGRVTVPTSIYRNIGYDERFLPRQFDEIDLILTVLRRFPSIPFLCYSHDKNAIALSKSTSQFVKEERIANPIEVLKMPPRQNPLNPKGGEYVSADVNMRSMTLFNQTLSYVKNTVVPVSRSRMDKRMREAKFDLIDTYEPGQLASTIFEDIDEGLFQSVRDIALVICVKNDAKYLRRSVEHYRRLGIANIFIIDDHSHPAVADLELQVVVVKPWVGDFRTSKTLWIEALARYVLVPGAWLMTVDADEFLDIPAGWNLKDILADAEDRSYDFVPGLLVDLIPGAAYWASMQQDAKPDFENVLTDMVCINDPMTEHYLSHSSIRWGFGKFASISWQFDTRYHAFGTFDSLRKFPLVRNVPHTHLNQGFHSVHYTDGRPQPNDEIWSRNYVLPIRHYKLLKLLERAHPETNAEHLNVEQYHDRTAINISRVFNSDALARLSELSELEAVPYAPEMVVEAIRLTSLSSLRTVEK